MHTCWLYYDIKYGVFRIWQPDSVDDQILSFSKNCHKYVHLFKYRMNGIQSCSIIGTSEKLKSNVDKFFRLVIRLLWVIGTPNLLR